MPILGRRLYLDEDVDIQVAERLRTVGLDVVTARDEERLGTEDEDQLIYATVQGRIIVTHNRDDFESLCHEWYRTGRQHPGIIISRRQMPHIVVRWVVTCLEAYPDLTSLCIRIPLAG